jgi:hypothetical protein
MDLLITPEAMPRLLPYFPVPSQSPSKVRRVKSLILGLAWMVVDIKALTSFMALNPGPTLLVLEFRSV